MAGFLSSLFGGAAGGLGGGIGGLLTNALIGGVVSKLTGGSFKQGALVGGIGSLLNGGGGNGLFNMLGGQNQPEPLTVAGQTGATAGQKTAGSGAPMSSPRPAARSGGVSVQPASANPVQGFFGGGGANNIAQLMPLLSMLGGEGKGSSKPDPNIGKAPSEEAMQAHYAQIGLEGPPAMLGYGGEPGSAPGRYASASSMLAANPDLARRREYYSQYLPDLAAGIGGLA